MILPDLILRARIDELILHEPLINPELQVQPASIDLTLNSTILVPYDEEVTIDPWAEGGKEHHYSAVIPSDGWVLKPGECILAATNEWVNVPTDLVARIEGRSTLARWFIIVHATAGFLDPGFSGRPTLEIKNLNKKRSIVLRANERVAQVAWTQMSGYSEVAYGSRNKYSDSPGVRAPEKDISITTKYTKVEA